MKASAVIAGAICYLDGQTIHAATITYGPGAKMHSARVLCTQQILTHNQVGAIWDTPAATRCKRCQRRLGTPPER